MRKQGTASHYTHDLPDRNIWNLSPIIRLGAILSIKCSTAVKLRKDFKDVWNHLFNEIKSTYYVNTCMHDDFEQKNFYFLPKKVNKSST